MRDLGNCGLVETAAMVVSLVWLWYHCEHGCGGLGTACHLWKGFF